MISILRKRDISNLYISLAQIIAKGLRKFKDIESSGSPVDLSEKEWKVCLNIMITGFSLYAQDKGMYIPNELKLMKKARELFAERFEDLWTQ